MFKERQPYQIFGLKVRLRAMGVHLLFSLLIFVVFLWYFLTYWFPSPQFAINGGWQGIRIMFLVDIVIGPLLTFFLFNTRKSKKELWFDLSLIVVIQFLLLAYGLWQGYSQRPAVQVISFRGAIYSPRYEDLVYQDIEKPSQLIAELNVFKTRPALVYSDYLSNDHDKKNLFSDILPHVDMSHAAFAPYMAVSTYRPMNDIKVQSALSDIAQRALAILAKDIKKQAIINAYQKANEGDFYFFRFLGEFGEAIAVLDKKGKPVDYIGVQVYEK